MTRFSGSFGYGEELESPPGSGDYRDVIVERTYFGKIKRNGLRAQPGDEENFSLTLDNIISVVADAYAWENMENLRYVTHRGNRWVPSTVVEAYPRLNITLGSLYEGPLPEGAEDELSP